MTNKPPLVGRAEEFAMARRAIAAASGSGGIVLAGSAGVGKSRLAREIVDQARGTRRPCHWLYATASARSVPLGVFAEFASSFGEDPLRRVHEVITALTDNQSSRATIVGVDDAHLLDEQSALVVHQLVQREAATVVITMRNGGSAPDAITSLYKDLGIPRLELQPLSAIDVAELLEQMLGGTAERATVQRLWRYTHGNVLYLRQLLEDERARGKLSRRSDIWVWTGHPEVSPTLSDLIESNVGRQDPAVLDVIDTVALADPLEIEVLQSLAPASAVRDAEARGVLVVDAEAGVVRLGHPLYGEVRRKRMGTLQRAALGRQVSDAIASLSPQTPQHLVRRAVLISGSDRPEDAELLTAAANSALYLMDLPLAVDLAERAMECGGSVASRILYGFALLTAARAEEGEQVLRDADAVVGQSADRAHIALFRAASLAWNLGRPADAEDVLDAAQPSSENYGLTTSFEALRISVAATRGDMPVVVRAAPSIMQLSDVLPTARMFCAWGYAAALGDVGDVDRLDDMASAGYAFAQSLPETSHLRFGLGVNHIDGLRLAGELGRMHEHAALLSEQAQDHRASLTIAQLLLGTTSAAQGDLRSAGRSFGESLAAYEYISSVSEHSGYWLAAVYGMAGDHVAAERQLRSVPDRVFNGSGLWDPLQHIAAAWAKAAAGQVSAALTTLTDATVLMRKAGRPARELWCLQTATQFGDTRTAARLAEIAENVQGPRAAAAAAHAAALTEGDGRELLSASRAYEAFGDKLAAADAAAQAAAAFRTAGSRGSALIAAARARSLAEECGADTPALRSMDTRAELTPRQREIASLVASGLSNRDIADRLHMSVRSVEGHIFRASQRNGVTSREALAALLDSRQRPDGRLG
ncbi:LuxR C-terminal-related transcriptional regulator [Mycolicibacterium sp. BiH015]|uniref:LuxR C-terminal-related transcriptional regulator n=1 Tax=Mycolicibacterium sp. BiH015 TaxID=3018808 RepID=UPI0022E45923|nr:LuxR C-terminal-related transcriptional regulator [Mycolicibacterium sp. BiH015]MDA2891456.1 LuxR C-terminal-related transcriptional regulator [Mycolicibacterium sp. BiH015]